MRGSKCRPFWGSVPCRESFPVRIHLAGSNVNTKLLGLWNGKQILRFVKKPIGQFDVGGDCAGVAGLVGNRFAGVRNVQKKKKPPCNFGGMDLLGYETVGRGLIPPQTKKPHNKYVTFCCRDYLACAFCLLLFGMLRHSLVVTIAPRVRSWSGNSLPSLSITSPTSQNSIITENAFLLPSYTVAVMISLSLIETCLPVLVSSVAYNFAIL